MRCRRAPTTIQNTEDVKLNFLIWSFTWPLWLLCVVMALGGGDRVVRIARPASSTGAVRDAAEWRVTRQHERFAFLDPRGGSRMKAEHVKSRLHGAMHRGSKKATEEEVAEVAAVVLAIVTEVTAELALVIAELAERVEQLEVRAG